MNISLIHPSRGRPEHAAMTAENWSRKVYDIVQYLPMLDEDDPVLNEYFKLFALNHLPMPIRTTSKTAIDAINNGAKIAEGDLLIVVSDDFDCPLHWDARLTDMLAGKSDFCVKTKDGYQPTLMTLPILDRAYYNRFGYIYNPIYQHMYADQEMTAVAHMLGRDISLDLQFTHNHYINHKREKDDIDYKNLRTMQSGKEIYNRRVKENFGLKDSEIVKLYNQIRWR